MARSEGQERSVSEDEYESMPERISNHFDRIRDLPSGETSEYGV